MATLRKGAAYRRLERPYTRRSKYKKKSFVRVTPAKIITRFDMGDLIKNFQYKLQLLSYSDFQLRQNAIESARLTSNRHLEIMLGKNGYFMKVRVYPHHMLRENPLAAGAGADRMSTGMAHSFGKVIGAAAQVKENQAVFEVRVDKTGIEAAKAALQKAAKKMPGNFRIIIEDIQSNKGSAKKEAK